MTNLEDERLRAPIPQGCLTCALRESWLVAGVERNRCKNGHPMHHDCGFFVKSKGPIRFKRGTQ